MARPANNLIYPPDMSLFVGRNSCNRESFAKVRSWIDELQKNVSGEICESFPTAFTTLLLQAYHQMMPCKSCNPLLSCHAKPLPSYMSTEICSHGASIKQMRPRPRSAGTGVLACLVLLQFKTPAKLCSSCSSLMLFLHLSYQAFLTKLLHLSLRSGCMAAALFHKCSGNAQTRPISCTGIVARSPGICRERW